MPIRMTRWGLSAPATGGRAVVAPPGASVIAFASLPAPAPLPLLARHEDVSSWLLHVPWAVSNDAFVYFGLAAHFAAVEARLPAIRGVTFPLAGLIGFIGLVNAWYLSVAGWQLNADIVSVGIQRLDDTLQIAGEQVSSMVTVVILVLSIAVAIPIALRYLLFRTKGPCKALEHGRERAHCALAAALLGGLMSLVLPTPLFFGAKSWAVTQRCTPTGLGQRKETRITSLATIHPTWSAKKSWAASAMKRTDPTSSS